MLGRFLQLVGLALPPLAILEELAGVVGTRGMLLMLVAGVSLFCVGRLVEGAAGRA